MTTSKLPRWALPPINRELKELDRSIFDRTVQSSAFAIFNARDTAAVKKTLAHSGDHIAVSAIPPVVGDPTGRAARLIVLEPHVKADQQSTWSPQLTSLVAEGKGEVRPHDIKLSYATYGTDDVLDAVLPEQHSDDHDQNPTGYAITGHVAHLNLKEKFWPYKHMIGQVILDKAGEVETVINKIQNVGTESIYRTFPYEVLAGRDDMNVTTKLMNCTFRFNFADVYWNTRLETEHTRLVNLFQPGQTMCDVTAGVGPFAVPAGKRGVWVHANDLNPACYEALKDAIKLNHVHENVLPYNTDGVDFIRTQTDHLLARQRRMVTEPKIKISRSDSKEIRQTKLRQIEEGTKTLQEPPTFDHYVMNLPASAFMFLHAFRGLYHGSEHLFAPNTDRQLPLVHFYTFQARKDTEHEEFAELREKLDRELGTTSEDEVELHRLRLVAPQKLYYRVTLRLPARLAFMPREPLRHGTTAN